MPWPPAYSYRSPVRRSVRASTLTEVHTRSPDRTRPEEDTATRSPPSSVISAPRRAKPGNSSPSAPPRGTFKFWASMAAARVSWTSFSQWLVAKGSPAQAPARGDRSAGFFSRSW